MQVIRNNELGGLMMIPLLIDWGIKRCNVEGCKSVPNTIVTQMGEGVPVAGFCEKHYQQGNVPGGTNYKLVFDDFDAFKYKEELGSVAQLAEATDLGSEK